MFNLKNNFRGFTLIEIAVVVSIIGLFSAVGYASYGEAKAQARDKIRIATMGEMRLAIELYKSQNGEYPEGCNGDHRWSGNVKSGVYKCTDPDKDFIIGLVPDFLPELPKDPLFNLFENNKGYFYITNTDRSAYKFISNNSLEKTVVEVGDEYAKCPTNCPDRPMQAYYGSCDQLVAGSFPNGLTEEELDDIYRREMTSTFSRSLGVYSGGDLMCS